MSVCVCVCVCVKVNIISASRFSVDYALSLFFGIYFLLLLYVILIGFIIFVILVLCLKDYEILIWLLKFIWPIILPIIGIYFVGKFLVKDQIYIRDFKNGYGFIIYAIDIWYTVTSSWIVGLKAVLIGRIVKGII